MTEESIAKDDNKSNDAAAAAATPDASDAAKNFDDFTIDVDKVANDFPEGKSPDGKNTNATDTNAIEDTKVDAKSNDDGDEVSSGGTEADVEGGTTANDSENGTSEDSENGSNKDNAIDVEKHEGEMSGDLESVKETGNTENEENGSSDAEEEGEPPEELWDLKLVLPVDQIRQASNRCDTPGCDLVACCIWSSSLDPETPWYCCLDCQANDFGGWPEKEEELPIKVLKDDLREVILDKCTQLLDPIMPDLPSGNPIAAAAATASTEEVTTEEDRSSDDGSGKENDSSGNDEEDGGEMWELKKVFNVKELKKSKPIMCSYGDNGECNLVACSKYVCISGDDPNPWFSCLDHQKSDYGGWPECQTELPMEFLTEENRQLILEKCSNEESEMPNIPTSQLLVTAGAADKGDDISAITPQASHDQAVAESQSDVIVGMALGKGSKKKKGGVTPSPMPPKGAAKKPARKKPSAAVTQKNLDMRNKWQSEAIRMGGPNARIVVSKPEAKKVIFDTLHDDFRPMNTNGLFQKLKGVVPPPVLRTCLDEMVDKFTGNPFDDSDDEDEKSSKKKAANKEGSDEYALRLKEGRNLNNNLYYVDHTKLANNGDGLLPDARNDLLSDMQGSKAEFDQLSLTLKKISSEASQLESQPKNEELLLEVIDLEKRMGDMNDSLEEARVHASNEKRVKQVKKGIENMTSYWRKRKRQCIEFISIMEEATEGTISLKKCLKGDGPIDIDSDEAAVVGATAFAKRKKSKVSLAGRGVKAGAKMGGDGSGSLRPDESFIGVRLTAQGQPERVYLEE